VWLNKGPLFDAIRASIAAPSIFAPVVADGRVLVDGSVANPVPVGPTLNDQTDLTVAVNLNGRFDATCEQIEPAPPPEDEGILAKFRREKIVAYIESSWPLGGEQADPSSLTMRDLVLRSMETMQQTITQVKFAANPPDVTVSIPRNLSGFFEFYRANELIEYGYQRAGHTFSRLD
jgi:NTE family protein